jgi:hypothetical protein
VLDLRRAHTPGLGCHWTRSINAEQVEMVGDRMVEMIHWEQRVREWRELHAAGVEVGRT